MAWGGAGEVVGFGVGFFVYLFCLGATSEVGFWLAAEDPG